MDYRILFLLFLIASAILAHKGYFTDEFTAEISEPSCHKGELASGWDESFCVRKNQLKQCDIDLHYRLSLNRETCGPRRYCCAMRRTLPDKNAGGGGINWSTVDRLTVTDTCGVSYYQDTYRIINGQTSEQGQWPWAASIEFGTQNIFRGKLNMDWEHQCGGVLISTRLVLTAAHCFMENSDTSRMRVVLGRHSLTKKEEKTRLYHNVSILHIHEQFKGAIQKHNDIAILLLTEEVERRNYIQPICLPARDHNSDKNKNRKCYIMGWGYTNAQRKLKPKELMHAQVNIFSNRRCDMTYGSGNYDHRTQICAGVLGKNVDACQGDSGGALACLDRYSNWQIVGLISWGEGCGRKDKPGIYTSVFAYKEWIQQKISDMSEFYVNTSNLTHPERIFYNLITSQEHSSVVFA